MEEGTASVAAEPPGAAPAAPAAPVASVAPAAPAAAPAVSAPTPVSVLSTDPRSSERGSRGKRAKPPFRLCFIVPGVAGRSALAPACLHAAPVSSVAGKFYSREEEKIKAELQRALDADSAGRGQPDASESEAARLRRGRDLLESARYGQYPRPLLEPRTCDRRLHFSFRTSDMVRVQCQIARAAALAAARGRQAANVAPAPAPPSTAAVAVAAAMAAAAPQTAPQAVATLG